MRRRADVELGQPAPARGIAWVDRAELGLRAFAIGIDPQCAPAVHAGIGLVGAQQSHAQAVEVRFEILVDRRGGEQADIGGVTIVAESGERDGAGAQPAADLVRRFEHYDAPAGACEIEGTDQPVVAATHDDRVIVGHPSGPLLRARA
jgi:hypothetical protein